MVKEHDAGTCSICTKPVDIHEGYYMCAVGLVCVRCHDRHKYDTLLWDLEALERGRTAPLLQQVQGQEVCNA